MEINHSMSCLALAVFISPQPQNTEDAEELSYLLPPLSNSWSAIMKKTPLTKFYHLNTLVNYEGETLLK